MAFVEDFAVFFNPADFAVAAVFQRQNVPVVACHVIFDDPTQQIEVYDQAVEELAPRLRARTADVTDVRRKDVVEVNGSLYRVERLSPDGTGVTNITLALAPAPENEQMI